MAQFPEGLVTISKPNSDLGKHFFLSASWGEGQGLPSVTLASTLQAPGQKQQHSLSNAWCTWKSYFSPSSNISGSVHSWWNYWVADWKDGWASKIPSLLLSESWEKTHHVQSWSSLATKLRGRGARAQLSPTLGTLPQCEHFPQILLLLTKMHSFGSAQKSQKFLKYNL